MKNFSYCTYTNFVFGRDTEQRVGQLCREQGATKVLIVIGGGSVVRSGLLQRVQDSLAEAGLTYDVLSGIRPNPEDDKVREGIAMVRQSGHDFLLAVGGGSVIDTTKAIAAGVCYDGDFWDFYTGRAKVEAAMPLGTVLTIPAAGSEGSGNTVITDRATRAKLGTSQPRLLRPRFSIMNPELTYTLPANQTAAGVGDMMMHILERYFSNTPHTEVTDRLSEGLLMAIMEVAPRLVADPEDYEARANIMWAGTQAHIGLCGTGVAEDWSTHHLEHELSAYYGVTHGAGLTALFPAWLELIGGQNPHKAVQLGVRVLGVDASLPEADIVRAAADRLRAFWRSIGLPVTLTELGIADRLDIDLIVDSLHAHKGELAGVYCPFDRHMTRRILEASL